MSLTAHVTIRRFEIRNLASILRIEAACFATEAWPVAQFRAYARHAPDMFLVARLGRCIVGYSIACLIGERAELDSIAVLPAYRGRRIASTLLRATLRKLRRSSATALCLMVRPANLSAVSFYRRYGFVRTATLARYYDDGSPAWRMRLPLTPPASEANPK